MPKASVEMDCGCSKDNKTSSFIFAALWLLGRLVYIRGVSDFNAKSGPKNWPKCFNKPILVFGKNTSQFYLFLCVQSDPAGAGRPGPDRPAAGVPA